MSADTLVEICVWIGAICSTAFVVLYPILSPGWWRALPGWGWFASSMALALLLDLSLAAKILGPEFFARYAAVRVGVVGLVALGTVLKLTALLVVKFRPFMRAWRIARQ